VVRTSLIIAALLAPVSAWAADAARVEAIHVSAASGSSALSEDFWKTAPLVSDFVQREPKEGAEPSQATEFRVAFDATTLYVKVRAFDREPEKIASYLTRRDEDTPSDWIRVFIDSYHDRRTAYEFDVNPAGVKQDRYWFNDTNNDASWDAVWDVAVSRDRLGWTAEFRIPFSQLRFSPSEMSTFGFAVARDIGRLKETSTWPLLSRNANGYVSSFGELGGFSTAGSSKRLEVVPYTVASLTRQPTGGNPLVSAAAGSGAVGMDMKYALTPGLTFTATVNPDFGQVEADPAVVNLSAFETFFNERRPFFIEGSGNFRFDADCFDGCNNLFYSRRIGRSPQGMGSLASGDGIYTDAPSQSTILGAAKLTGRIGRYSIGVMHAVTQQEFADVSTFGVRSEQAVEPSTSYSVARVKREYANQSYIGAIGTMTNRRVADTLNFIPSSAYVGGADFDWRVRRFYSVNGFIEGSRVKGASPAIEALQENNRHLFQRPGLASAHLDVTRTALSGYAGAVAFNKIGGEYVHSNSYVYFRSPGFDTNDLGFLRRADQIRQGHWLQLRSNKVTGWFRQRTINFNQWTSWNFDGDIQFGGGNINANATLTNNWQMGVGAFMPLPRRGFDDRMTRGGPGVISEGQPERWFWIYSDNRRLFSAGLEGNFGSDDHNTSWQSWYPSMTVRPIPAVMFSLTAQINPSHQDSQWVNNVTDSKTHYVFAHLDQTTVNVTGRFNYTITPNLSLQLYAQPFVSAGSYGAFKEVADPRSDSYEGRYSPFAYPADVYGTPDFNVKSFRTTNVLRWEYKPGSTLFVVWQQARENDAVPGGFNVGRDTRDIFGVPPHNVFLVKLAYWLNY
jgi:Domain of unknown function (DUF5916)/Carbohydrate family 9 binding domain-like